MMSPHNPPDAVDGSAARAADPSPSPSPSHLQLVSSQPGTLERTPATDRAYRLLQRHLRLADRLGVVPQTVTERAESLLDAACEGWLVNGYCTSPTSAVLDHPHPACVQAQYHHDLLLLEHDLLGVPESATQEAAR